jgi:hypothetical protein
VRCLTLFVQLTTSALPKHRLHRAALFARGRPNGGIGPETHVWFEELESWTRLKEMGHLVETLQSRSLPAPPQHDPHHHHHQPPPLQQQQQQPPPQHGQHADHQAAAARSSGGSSARESPPLTLPSNRANAPEPPAAASTTTPAGGKGGKGGGSAHKHNPVRNFLLGWLPHRAPPRELVQRGILEGGTSLSHPGQPAPAGPDEIFGGRLENVLRRRDTVDGVPRIAAVLMDRLRENDHEGLRSEGIFRIPGDQGEVHAMRRQINEGGDPAAVAAACGNLHSVAGLLKMFYRETQPPLFTFGLYDEFIACACHLGAPAADEPLDAAELISLIARLPDGHRNVLHHLMSVGPDPCLLSLAPSPLYPHHVGRPW